jgi:hypothetical protein
MHNSARCYKLRLGTSVNIKKKHLNYFEKQQTLAQHRLAWMYEKDMEQKKIFI